MTVRHRRLTANFVAPFFGCATLYLAWHLMAMWMENPVLLPAPAIVFQSLWDILGDELPADILASLRHLGMGMSIGVVVGFALAFVAAGSDFANAVIDPAIELLRPISGIAWIPLAIMMFGIGETVPIFLIAYVSVFPIFINTLAGIRGVDPRLIAAANVLGATPSMIRWQVVLPAALPMILSGLRLSLGVAWMTLIGAELIGADSGLGWRAFWYEQFFAMHKNLAVIIVVGVLGFSFDFLIRMAQKHFTRWAMRPEGGDE